MKLATGTGSISCLSLPMVPRWMRARMRRSQNSSSTSASAAGGRNLPRSTSPSPSRRSTAWSTVADGSARCFARPDAVKGPAHSTRPRTSSSTASSISGAVLWAGATRLDDGSSGRRDRRLAPVRRARRPARSTRCRPETAGAPGHPQPDHRTTAASLHRTGHGRLRRPP